MTTSTRRPSSRGTVSSSTIVFPCSRPLSAALITCGEFSPSSDVCQTHRDEVAPLSLRRAVCLLSEDLPSKPLGFGSPISGRIHDGRQRVEQGARHDCCQRSLAVQP